jgi:hypothetical protein
MEHLNIIGNFIICIYSLLSSCRKQTNEHVFPTTLMLSLDIWLVFDLECQWACTSQVQVLNTTVQFDFIPSATSMAWHVPGVCCSLIQDPKVSRYANSKQSELQQLLTGSDQVFFKVCCYKSLRFQYFVKLINTAYFSHTKNFKLHFEYEAWDIFRHWFGSGHYESHVTNFYSHLKC